MLKIPIAILILISVLQLGARAVDIPLDKSAHFATGFGLQAVFESWGDPSWVAFLKVTMIAAAKEYYDSRCPDNRWDDGDLYATMSGALGFELVKGVNLRFLYKK